MCQAEDTRLRRVALKFLPDDVFGDPQALARFQREARAASALNHPNICTIHDIGEDGGKAFIAMEYLDGQTLKHLTGDHPMELEHLLEVAIEIADALDAAHSKGIIHRDIKPANLFVTERGHAKILDFNSQVDFPDAFSGSAARGPTMDYQLLTSPGTALRHRRLHVSRASPRQGAGLAHRPLLLWRGSVPNGDRHIALRGDTSANLFDAILHQAPSRPSASTPTCPKLEEVINKALEKERKLRYQGAAEMRAEPPTAEAGFPSPPATFRGAVAMRRPSPVRAPRPREVQHSPPTPAVQWWWLPLKNTSSGLRVGRLRRWPFWLRQAMAFTRSLIVLHLRPSRTSA